MTNATHPLAVYGSDAFYDVHLPPGEDPWEGFIELRHVPMKDPGPPFADRRLPVYVFRALLESGDLEPLDSGLMHALADAVKCHRMRAQTRRKPSTKPVSEKVHRAVLHARVRRAAALKQPGDFET